MRCALSSLLSRSLHSKRASISTLQRVRSAAPAGSTTSWCVVVCGGSNESLVVSTLRLSARRGGEGRDRSYCMPRLGRGGEGGVVPRGRRRVDESRRWVANCSLRVARSLTQPRARAAPSPRACRRAGAACGAERGALGLHARRGGAALRRGRGSARAVDLGGGALRGGDERNRPHRGPHADEHVDGGSYFFSPRRSLRARVQRRSSYIRRRARASSRMLRACGGE